MVRECVALCVLASFAPGCSLILDFDSKLPADAAIDAVYTPAECEYLEPNDSIAGAKDVTASDTGPAAICAANVGDPEDHDFYRFTAAGTTATVAIAFMNRTGGDLDLKLYSGDGTMIAQSRGFTDGESITCPGTSPACPMLTAGPYILEVLPGVNGAVNSYTFSITEQ
jgi:hypothetical protein